MGADDATRTKEKKERIGGEEEQPGHSCCLDMNKHKQHIIFAGTSVMLHRNETAHFAKTKVPEKACVGFVLRTAFTTTQVSASVLSSFCLFAVFVLANLPVLSPSSFLSPRPYCVDVVSAVV